MEDGPEAAITDHGLDRRGSSTLVFLCVFLVKKLCCGFVALFSLNQSTVVLLPFEVVLEESSLVLRCFRVLYLGEIMFSCTFKMMQEMYVLQLCITSITDIVSSVVNWP